MLLATLERYRQVFTHLAVVLRPEDDELRGLLQGQDPDLLVVIAPDARLGMGHSLAQGAAAPALQEWRALFVGLGDMPFVDPNTLRLLEQALARAPADSIVQPRYNGQPGHPVGFAGRFLTSLQTLTGDSGAREVVRQAAAQVIHVDVNDPGVIQDVDRPP